MAAHNEVGKKGEKLAVDFLIEKGYKILEQNWRFSKAEVDIIAMQKEVLVFLEVKTRSSTFFGEPEIFVSEKKELFLVDAAHVYMEQINHDWEIRFDVIGIVMRRGYPLIIRHFEDAFFPSL